MQRHQSNVCQERRDTGGTREWSLDTCHVWCVRSLDSCTASDNNLSFCLCDWSTRDTRDLHCPALFLVQTFLYKLQSGGSGDLTNQNVRGEGGGQILSWVELKPGGHRLYWLWRFHPPAHTLREGDTKGQKHSRSHDQYDSWITRLGQPDCRSQLFS